MASQAIAAVRTEPDSAANLEFYRMRDDFTRAYQPITEEERLLLTQMIRAWQHLEDIYELRACLTAGKGLSGLFRDEFETYKRLMRDLGDAEHMWRNALHEFNRARRNRDSRATNGRRPGYSIVPSTRPQCMPVETAPETPNPSADASSLRLTTDHWPLTPSSDEPVLNSQAPCHKMVFGRREETPSSQTGCGSETRCSPETACRDGGGPVER